MLQDSAGNGTVNPTDTQIIQLPAPNNNDRELSQKLAFTEKEVDVLRARLVASEVSTGLYQMQVCHGERLVLRHLRSLCQVQNFYAQVTTLAREMDQNRMAAITSMFSPTKFVEDGFESQQFLLTLSELPNMFSVLPNVRLPLS